MKITLFELPPSTLRTLIRFAQMHERQGRYIRAEQLLIGAHDELRTQVVQSRERADALRELYEVWGKPEKASDYRALLAEAETLQ